MGINQEETKGIVSMVEAISVGVGKRPNASYMYISTTTKIVIV